MSDQDQQPSGTTDTEILTALRDRLVQEGGGTTDRQYPLNSATLPAGVPGSPDVVSRFLDQHLGDSPVVGSDADPVLDTKAGTLTLKGRSAVLESESGATTVTFTVSGGKLRVDWRTVPGERWTLSHTYPALHGTLYETLPLYDPLFVLTDHDQPASDGVFFALKAGLHFQAGVTVGPDLVPVARKSPPAGSTEVRVGGPLSVAEQVPSFTWPADKSCGAFTVPRPGQGDLSLQDGRLTLTCQPSTKAGTCEADAAVVGTVDFEGGRRRASLAPPQGTPSTRTLTLTASSWPATVEEALAVTGCGKQIEPRVPAKLLALTGSRIDACTLTFAPDGKGPTASGVRIGYGSDAAWQAADGIAFSRVALEADATRTTVDATVVTSWTVSVLGTVRLGSADLAMRASAGPWGCWHVEPTDPAQQLPSLDTLAGLSGLATSSVTALLPGSLYDTEQPLTLSRAGLDLDPADRTLCAVSFTLAQTTPWPLIDKVLTLSGWTADVRLEKTAGTWRAMGLLSGALGLGATQQPTLAVTMAVPVGKDTLWTLRLQPGTQVTLPSAQDVFGLLTGSQAALPPGVGSVGGLEVLDLLVAVAPSPPAVRRLGLLFAQQKEWTVIDKAVTVQDLTGAVDLRRDDGTSSATGELSGVLTLAGRSVDVRVERDEQHQWVLHAAQAVPVHVPGFEKLDSWLSPDAAKSALPAELPLSKGIDVADVSVRFGGENGAADRIGLTVGTPEPWTIVPGSLSLNDVWAELSMPYPVKADGITGTVRGSITLGGLTVLMTAHKPEEATGTWEFTGTAQYGPKQPLALDTTADAVTKPAQDNTWAQVVPSGMNKLELSAAASLYLDPSRPLFLLYGRASFGPALTADALLYCARRSAQDSAWVYAAAARLGQDFRLSALSPALSGLDDVLRCDDVRLVVCDLGSGDLKGLAETTNSLLQKLDSEAAPPLKDLPDTALPLAKGVYLAARTALGSSPVLTHLVDVTGDGGKAPAVTVTAVVDRKAPTQTSFTADLPCITVLDTLTLGKATGASGVRLTFQPNKHRAFTLAGPARLKLFETEYAFDLTLYADTLKLTSKATPSAQELDQPFGLPGLVVSGLELSVDCTWAVPAKDGQAAQPRHSQFTVKGSAKIGPAPGSGKPDQRLAATAALALVDGHPALLLATLDADVAIGSFLAQCVTGDASTWPSDFVELTVRKDSTVYYYDAKKDPGKTLEKFGGATTPYLDQFHLDARIRLTLDVQVDVRGLLSFRRENGRTTGITGTLALEKPVDLAVVELAGTTTENGRYTGGPELSLTRDGGTKKFALSTGVNFLQAAFTTVEVSAAARADGGRCFTGTLKAAKELPPFGTLDCGFTYTTHPSPRKPELTIDWPGFDWPGKVIDLLKQIQQIADSSGSGSGCGTLADIAVQNAYTENLSLHPKVSLSDAGTLRFALTPAFSLTLKDAEKPFFSQDLPALTVDVPAGTTWPDLPAVLGKGLADGARDYVKKLLQDTDKIALIAAFVFGKRAAAYLAGLVCRGLANSDAPAAGEAGAGAAGSAPGGYGGAGAVAAAVAAITTSRQDSNDHKKKQGNGNDGSHGGPDPTPGRPTMTSLTYAKGQLTACWDTAPYATGYEFEVVRPSGQKLASDTVDNVITKSVAVDAATLAPGTYSYRVRSRRGGRTSDWAQLTIEKPVSPVPDLTWEDTEAQLRAQWTGTAPDSYHVRFTDPAGKQLGQEQTVKAAPYTAVQPVATPVPGRYAATVRVERAGTIPADPGKPGTRDIIDKPTPVIQEVWYEDDRIHVRWNGGEGATRYQAQVLKDSTVVASCDTDGSAREAALSPQRGTFAPGTRYRVQVRVHTDGGDSAWAGQDFTVPAIQPPTVPPWTVDADRIVVRWEPLASDTAAGAVSYDIRLLATATPDQPVATADAVAAPPVTLVPSGGGHLADGTEYGIRVRARVGRDTGPWSQPVTRTFRALPAPGSPKLEFSGAPLDASWQGAEDPQGGKNSYELALSAGDDHLVGPLTVDDLAYTFTPAQPLPDGQECTLRVRRTRDGDTSAWAEATTRYPGAVTLIEARYADGRASVTWATSPLADAGYQVDMTDEHSGNTSSDTLRPQGQRPAATTTTFAVQPPAAGVVLRFLVTVVIDPSSGPSSPPLRIAAADPVTGVTPTWNADGRLEVAWQAAGGAAGYRVTVTDQAGHLTVTDTQGPVTSTVAGTDGLAPHTPWTVTVAVLVDGIAAEPTAAVPVPPQPVPPPTVRFTVIPAVVRLSWDRVEDAQTYEVQLLKNGEPEQSDDSDGYEQKDFFAQSYRDAYQARVRVRTPHTGAWSDTVTVGLVPPDLARALSLFTLLANQLRVQDPTLTPDFQAVFSSIGQDETAADSAGSGPYTAACLGAPPGGSCTLDGASVPFAAVREQISMERRTDAYRTGRPQTSGWAFIGEAPASASLFGIAEGLTRAAVSDQTAKSLLDAARKADVVCAFPGDGYRMMAVCTGDFASQDPPPLTRFGDVKLDLGWAEAHDGYAVTGDWQLLEQSPFAVEQLAVKLAALLVQKGKVSAKDAYGVFDSA
ncbi:fibronectin type III domain-containing protein [Kitasatospora sp. NPDC094016]|uniref:fibronectin type III domain-containing protein n=1 Tax=Kitasatospora sp. NPDC094016 TaxID=3154986 RepID=UPI003333ED6C